MHLYHLTVEGRQQWLEVVVGQFVKDDPTSQQLVISLGSSLSVVALASGNDSPKRIHHQLLVGSIWKIAKIRPIGYSADLLVVTLDLGNLVILEFTNVWARVLCQPFAKNGYNRTNAGEFLAVDPQNRYVMLLALQRTKIVYGVNHENGQLTVLPPVQFESDKNLVVLKLVAVENNYDDPLFATIETDRNCMWLRWYQFDQGLNTIRPAPPISLPDDNYHLFALRFGGVFVCLLGKLSYYSGPKSKADPVVTDIPLKLPIVASTIQNNKSSIFVLIQDTGGHLWRVVVNYDTEREFVDKVAVTYYDTIAPCLLIHILRAGYLVANTVTGDSVLYLIELMGSTESELWKPRDKMENLEVASVIHKGSPVVDATVHNQALLLARTKDLVKVQKGTPTLTLVALPLPFVPTAIFTTATSQMENLKKYLVISLAKEAKTLVLLIGEVVEEVKDSKFIENQVTIAVAQVGKESLVQIYADGINHVAKSGKQTIWHPPAGIVVVAATANRHQVVAVLLNRELVYFEVDTEDDQLAEYGDRLELDSEPTCTAMVTTGRANFVVVGTASQEIQVVLLQRELCLEIVLLQALLAPALSLFVSGLLLGIGMELGVYVSNSIDPVTGTITGTRKRYVGSLPVSIFGAAPLGQLVVLSTLWFLGSDGNLSPLLGVDLVCGAGFSSEDIGGDAIAGINCRGELVIFNVDDPDEEDMISMGSMVSKAMSCGGGTKKIVADGETVYVATALGVEVLENEETKIIEGVPNCSKAMLMARAKIKGKQYLFVSLPGKVVLISVSDEPTYLHTTDTYLSGYQAVVGFQGRLLVGCGRKIRYYDIGHKQLLFKGETKFGVNLGNIVALADMEGDRLAIGDALNSVRIVHYDQAVDKFLAVADDIVPRHLTAMTVLDHSTIAGGDRFGNLWINRLDDTTSKAVDSLWPLWTSSHPDYLQAAPVRTKTMAQFATPDAIIRLIPALLVFGGGQQGLVYFGILGTVGVMMPLVTLLELKLFDTLAIAIRKRYLPLDAINLLGKDPLKFRGYYQPPVNVVDGDFIETYFGLDAATKKEIAEEVGRLVVEVERRVLEVRDRIVP